MTHWRWILLQMSRRLWLRATLIGALGIAAALSAALIDQFIPWKLPISIGADSVESILDIIASSMLTVTTFSLSVMTSAYSAATSSVTPRATKLLIEDRITQNVLSTFIGSFLFGIVSIVVLKTGAYTEQGRVTLFMFTVGIIVLIVVSLLRWIDHLTRLGRVGETTARVEQATQEAIEQHLKNPYLGAQPLHHAAQVPDTAYSIYANQVGYIQHIDAACLSQIAEQDHGSIFVSVLPGTFVYQDTPIAHVTQRPNTTEEAEALIANVQKGFLIGSERNFDQDPRFGLSVMSEISARALSPAVNDPGTAIDVIGRATRLMSLWANGWGQTDPEISYPRVYIPALNTEDLFEDAFLTAARDGAGLIEVQLRLQKALSALSRIGDESFQRAAQHQAKLAYQRAEAALTLEADRQRLRDCMQT